MKLRDLKSIIQNLEESFGEGVLNEDLYIDTTFGRELMVNINSEFVTPVLNLDNLPAER